MCVWVNIRIECDTVKIAIPKELVESGSEGHWLWRRNFLYKDASFNVDVVGGIDAVAAYCNVTDQPLLTICHEGLPEIVFVRGMPDTRALHILVLVLVLVLDVCDICRKTFFAVAGTM